MADLNVELFGLRLDNPLILASGILGTTKGALASCAKAGAGAVTIKSITLEPRKGHKSPTLVEVEDGFLNAVGYSNMGLAEALCEFKNIKDVGVPVFASVVGKDAAEFAKLAAEMSRIKFAAIELPLSCPHTPGLGLLAGHGTPEATYGITKAVKKKTKLPVIVKLSPNVMNLGEVAKAAVKAGADAINMGNSVGPGMKINIEAKKSVLDYKAGGLTGPAIKPITVRCVYDVYEATKGKTPIIGTGGVTYGRDAIELMMAGATAVGVGTAVYYRGIKAFKYINNEIQVFTRKTGVSGLGELIGVAHR
ncbi:MAG: dihydroorotate dehydrogenase [Candidatus Altiarchaeota archaeon]|nr:dihydroorotate dehydrogenase [Candidatus Altiarchaeota archaeon]